jgi:enterochelin esterase-like enzyme
MRTDIVSPKVKKSAKLLWSSVAVLSLLAGAGYWYVFIAGAPQLDSPKAELHTGVTFKVETFESQAMRSTREYGVILPPGYNRHPHRRYPVVVLLHGGHGNAEDYQRKAALTSVIHDLYRQHRLPPSIIITPDGSDDRGTSPFWDPEYFNGKNGTVATLIGEDLVEMIKSRYRTLDDPRAWAMGGISSGGWGAVNIGLQYIGRFGTLFSHSGYFIDKSGKENSPYETVLQLSPEQRKQVRIYLDAGEQDGKYLDSSEQFQQRLQQLGIENRFNVFPGGHGIVGQDSGWNYWHKHLSDSLTY